MSALRLRHTGVPLNSVVELARLMLDDFKLEDEGVAELLGLERARMAVDGCLGS